MLIPARSMVCLMGEPHLPLPEVETGDNGEVEWQHATCSVCAAPISRYRVMRGGYWFDRWGEMRIPDDAMEIESRNDQDE